MNIVQCKTSHVVNPIGYAMEKPIFSYQVEGATGKRQAEARILVSLSPDMTSPVYDTGFTDAIDSLAFAAELPLCPRTRYYWTVTVRTDAGEEATSAINWFETAKMDEPWAGQWITCDSAEVRHPFFSKNIAVSRPLKSARLYICGLGLYEAFIGGNRVGEEYFTPYSNDYTQWLQYQTYDVTAELLEGAELSVLLGNGWYKGRFGFTKLEPQEGYYGKTWKLMAEVRLTYVDGSEEVIATDESWRVTRSNITFSNLYDGEKEDANLPAVSPVQATICEEALPPLIARYSTAVTVHEQLRPVEIIKTPLNETVIDVGQNLAGSFRLRVHLKKGETLRLQFGEVLQNGCFYRDNLRSAQAEYVWVSDGEAHVLCPHFTFYGYRFVKVEGMDGITADDFTALALYSDIPETGNIVTGHALVNQLIQNTRWGQKGNYLDVPTDCPQRDERMGWTGDAQVFSPTAAYLTDCFAFMRKFLYDMSYEQKGHGGMVPDVVPCAGHHRQACAWGDATCIIPWNMYVFYGDASILEAHFDAMKAWVDYLQRLDGDNHQWGKEFHYGDWLALDLPTGRTDEVFGATDEGFIANVYYRNSAELTAKAARVLGKTEEAAHYQQLADTLLAYIQSEYYSSTGRCCIDTQTAHILTVYFNLQEDKSRAQAALKRLFKLSKGKLRTGFIGTPLMCNVLSDLGDSGAAYELLLNEEYPGWLREIKLGATTIWERWNSINDDGSISSTGMNSLNHYAYGSVVEWIFRHAAGIQPVEGAPGFRKAILRPTPSARLGTLDASYQSAAGLYRVSWKVMDKEHLELSVTVPFGCTAELYLPFSKEGMLPLTSGTYTFAYQTTQEMA